jgi:hypothetical protein
VLQSAHGRVKSTRLQGPPTIVIRTRDRAAPIAHLRRQPDKGPVRAVDRSPVMPTGDQPGERGAGSAPRPAAGPYR